MATLKEIEESAPSFQKSDSLLAAEQALADYQTSKPQAYVSSYQSQIDDLLNQVLNRQPFSYDFNADPLYQQYRTQYTQAGRLASEDVQAQSAALTGGYGNSYGVTAASQAYQKYLGQLNNMLPTLANNAYSRYQGEGDRLNANLTALRNADASDYSRWSDQLSDYYNQLNVLTNQANTLYNREYGAYSDAYAAWQADRAYAWQKEQAAKSGGSGSGSDRYRNDDIEDVDIYNAALSLIPMANGGSSAQAALAYIDDAMRMGLISKTVGGQFKEKLTTAARDYALQQAGKNGMTTSIYTQPTTRTKSSRTSDKK